MEYKIQNRLNLNSKRLFFQRSNLLKNFSDNVAKYAVEAPNCAKCILPFLFHIFCCWKPWVLWLFSVIVDQPFVKVFLTSNLYFQYLMDLSMVSIFVVEWCSFPLFSLILWKIRKLDQLSAFCLFWHRNGAKIEIFRKVWK